jgi:hypothetical protein
MATRAQPRIDLTRLFGKRGYGAEAKRIEASAAESLARSRTLLAPMDVAGEYDAARLLKTTLGGQLRPLTLEDLRAFSASAAKLGKRFKGGITARGVVDASAQIDRDRSNTQIRTAVIVKAQAGLLHFITNASADSDSIRHHVYVEFPAFKAFSASPNDPKKLARPMLNGPLKFSCDCGRARYFLDYVATIGGFKYGPPQRNFPKIRNPRLVGVACKHALRVMQAVLKDPNVTTKAAAMIGSAQKNDTRAQITTAAEAKAQAQKQIDQAHHLKNRAETTAEQLKRRAGTPAGRAKAMQAAAREAQRRAAAAAAKSRKDLEAAFAKLQAAPLTKAMRDALIAKLQAANTID